MKLAAGTLWTVVSFMLMCLASTLKAGPVLSTAGIVGTAAANGSVVSGALPESISVIAPVGQASAAVSVSVGGKNDVTVAISASVTGGLAGNASAQTSFYGEVIGPRNIPAVDYEINRYPFETSNPQSTNYFCRPELDPNQCHAFPDNETFTINGDQYCYGFVVGPGGCEHTVFVYYVVPRLLTNTPFSIDFSVTASSTGAGVAIINATLDVLGFTDFTVPDPNDYTFIVGPTLASLALQSGLPPPSVPEPASWMILLTSVAGLGWLRRRWLSGQDRLRDGQAHGKSVRVIRTSP